MVTRVVKLFSMIIDPIGYFVIVFFIVTFLIQRGLENVLTSSTVAVIGLGFALLWCGSYVGTWISIAERDRQKFGRAFLLFDLCPGLIGATSAIIFYINK